MATVIRRPRSPFWYARFRVDGRDVIRSTEEVTRRKAEAVMRKWLAQENGDAGAEESFRATLDALRRMEEEARTDPTRTTALREQRRRWAAEILRGSADPLPLKAVWNTWLHSPTKRTPGPVTLAGYLAIWKRFKKWLEERSPPIKHLHEVSPPVAIDYTAELSSEGRAGATFNAHVKFLRALFKALRLKAGIAENPFDQVATMEKNTAVRRELTAAEIKAVLQIAKGEDKLMIAVGVFTGLRMGDVAHLTWKAVNFQTGMISLVPSKTSRKGKRVAVPLHPALTTELKAWRKLNPGEETAPIFPVAFSLYAKDRALLAARFTTVFKNAGIATTASMPGRKRAVVVVGFHSLRHSFVSLCAASGVPQHVVQTLVGHGSPAMTEHYTHVNAEQKRLAIAALPAMEAEPPAKPPA